MMVSCHLLDAPQISPSAMSHDAYYCRAAEEGLACIPHPQDGEALAMQPLVLNPAGVADGRAETCGML